jgi:NAD-dependent deacetylase
VPELQAGIEEALARWAQAARGIERCAVLTGAGISAESGVPTFRGPDGLWKQYRVEELATPEAFERNPALVLEWYHYRRDLLKGIEPNAGHRAIAALEGFFETFTLITQNVDGLHVLAGSTDVVELHGNIRRDRCHRCGRRAAVPAPRECACGGPMRPDVIWFGELLPADAVERAWRAAATAQLFLVVGTSALVYPAAQLPYLAKEAEAFVVEVNTAPTPFSDEADLVLRGTAGHWLPLLVDALAAGGGSARS